MYDVVFPCCGTRIKDGHRKKLHELQEIYDEHKKTCKVYKKWKAERERKGDE